MASSDSIVAHVQKKCIDHLSSARGLCTAEFRIVAAWAIMLVLISLMSEPEIRDTRKNSGPTNEMLKNLRVVMLALEFVFEAIRTGIIAFAVFRAMEIGAHLLHALTFYIEVRVEAK